MQRWRLPCRRAVVLSVLAVLAVLAVLPRPAAAVFSRRTCFCDLRLGRGRIKSAFSRRGMMSRLLLDVPNPVLKGYLLSCRRAKAWCPDACHLAARARLVQGGDGDVSPLQGVAGETACAAGGHMVAAEATPHLYATYRVSNCRHIGSHYFGRLCCWAETDGGGRVSYTFNESCQCEQQASIGPTAASGPAAESTHASSAADNSTNANATVVPDKTGDKTAATAERKDNATAENEDSSGAAVGPVITP